MFISLGLGTFWNTQINIPNLIEIVYLLELKFKLK